VITSGLVELGRWQETVDLVSEAFDRVPAATEVIGVLSRLLENRVRALDALGRRAEAVADQARLVRVRESIGDDDGATAARSLLEAVPDD